MVNLNQESNNNNNLFINGSIPTPHNYNSTLNNITTQPQLNSVPFPTLNNSVGSNYIQINQYNNHNGLLNNGMFMATTNVGYPNFSPGQNSKINNPNNNIHNNTNNFHNSPQYATPVQPNVGYIGSLTNQNNIIFNSQGQYINQNQTQQQNNL